MKKIIITFFILSANILFAQAWDIIGAMENPVAGGSVANKNEMIYISGGYSKKTQSHVTWIQEYNTVSRKSKILANMKIPRYGHASSFINNKLYFAGGVHDAGNINMSLEEWDIATKDTTSLVATNINFNRIFSSEVTKNNLLYLIGGNPYSDLSTNKLSYIIEYDIINDTILYKFNESNYVKKFPEQQMSALFGDDIYIFGGVSNGVLQSILKFNTQTHKLDTLEIELLEPRAGGVAVRKGFSNQIYIIGGFNEGNTALKSVEILSIYGNNYYINSAPKLNEARSKLMALSHYDDNIYVFGGYNDNNVVLSSIEKLSDSATSELDEAEKTIQFRLEQNYPNPFNPTTTIKYAIPTNKKREKANVKLIVYDILGRVVTTLVNKEQEAGNYKINFNSNKLNSGVYFYKLQVYGQTSLYSETKKMTVLK